MLTNDEQSALYALKNGLPIDDNMGHALYLRGLCEQKTALEEDGTLSRIGWSISSDGLRLLESKETTANEKRRDSIQTWTATAVQVLIALAAIGSFIIALLKR